MKIKEERKFNLKLTRSELDSIEWALNQALNSLIDEWDTLNAFTDTYQSQLEMLKKISEATKNGEYKNLTAHLKIVLF